jgi:pimeloyl-ACP methyl ester carboxylesterase
VNAAATNNCITGDHSLGAKYKICVPDNWNGDVLTYAHGYVRHDEPLEPPDDEVEGIPISEIVNALGFAYAASSYSANGLWVPEAVEDNLDLLDVFAGEFGPPRHSYLVGASEGGLVTTLTLERAQDKVDGGLAVCGPVGSFQGQLNYFGDFRVIFDYFFPDIAALLGDPFAIPEDVMEDWEAIYEPAVRIAIASNPHATEQLLRVTRAPIDPTDPTTVEETVLGLLRYSIFATNNGTDRLGGRGYGNNQRWYFGSDNDLKLNLTIPRFTADPIAVEAMRTRYETSGRLGGPLVTLHTTGDPIVPYWHEPVYRWKVFLGRSSLQHLNLPILGRYGHCSFNVSEVLAGLAILVLKVSLRDLIASADVFPSAESQAEFLRLAWEAGARPQVTDEPLHTLH